MFWSRRQRHCCCWCMLLPWRRAIVTVVVVVCVCVSLLLAQSILHQKHPTTLRHLPPLPPGDTDLYDAGSKRYKLKLNGTINYFHTPLRPAICDESAPNGTMSEENIVILVMSTNSRVDNRLAVRDTWLPAARHVNVSVIFVLAQNNDIQNDDGTESSDRLLTQENGRFGDMLLLQGVDEQYRNLPRKVAAAFVWAHENCRRADWMMKTDDDVLLQPDIVRDAILQARPHGFAGYCYENGAPVRRDTSDKWFIPRTSLTTDYFPPYCSGSGYVLRRSQLPMLAAGWQTVPLIHLEDVWTTGLVAEAAGVPRLDLSPLDPQLLTDSCNVRYQWLYHRPRMSRAQFVEAWHEVQLLRKHGTCFRLHCIYTKGRLCYLFPSYFE